MSKPFDTTTRELVERYPADWVRWLGLPIGRVDILDADLMAISAEADRVIRVTGTDADGNDFAYILHIEFQSGRDEDMAARLARYSILLWYRYRLPVVSVVVLLARVANVKNLNGRLRIKEPEGSYYFDFRYRVVRVWEQSPEEILQGGLGTLPFAPLGAVTKKDLPGIIRRMASRFDAETTRANAGRMWTATFIMAGLRYDEAFIERLLKGVMAMKESVTYQAILREGRAEGIELGREEGREEGERRVILRIGAKRFGTPSTVTVAELEAAELSRLESLAERLMEVESWDELLQ